MWHGQLRRLDEYRWLIPRTYKPGMRTDGLIYADEELVEAMRADQAPEQVANVACLPGIVGRALAMPDIHWGYGFPIGGVAATDAREGVISPGGVGYDINCGVRLLRTNLRHDDVRPRLDVLVGQLYRDVPSGVGKEGPIPLDQAELRRVLEQGARWAVEAGYGLPGDLEVTEEGGALAGADPAAVSDRAKKRGGPQLGTLGSGNHFLEVGVVDQIYDPAAAAAYGLVEGQVVVLIHSGSRGLGHQICTDYIEIIDRGARRLGIDLPDRQLACAPLDSREGRDYLAAMACGSNYAWANRQCLTHWVRQAFARTFGVPWTELDLSLVYDQAHNIAKLETHEVEGRRRRLCVHRKGASRAFPPGHPDVPAAYRGVGQPVLVPGDMGRSSFVLAGREGSLREAFGSCCHGAGRTLSRGAAKRGLGAAELKQRLAQRGIVVRAASAGGLVEEAPEAYKDIEAVVRVANGAGLAARVARTRPMGVIKG